MEAESLCPHCHHPIAISIRKAPSSLDAPEPRTVDPKPRPVQQQQQQQRRPDGSLMPMPMTVERAAAFAIPFGKHRGSTIAEVAEKDIDYLRWGAKEWDRGLGRAAVFFLDHLDNPAA